MTGGSDSTDSLTASVFAVSGSLALLEYFNCHRDALNRV